MIYYIILYCFFFFNDTATTEIYTLSLHDALPISCPATDARGPGMSASTGDGIWDLTVADRLLVEAKRWGNRLRFAVLLLRSEEHTSELQSRQYLVCRLLLEKKKKKK